MRVTDTLSEEDRHFMKLALRQAERGLATDGAAEIGCVIVRGSDVVASGFNEAQLRWDPTAHAEIVTLRKLGQQTQQIKFHGCTLYVTLQPCNMCASACVWAGISRIVYGAARSDVHSMYFEAENIEATDLVADAFRSSITISGGVMASECAALYYGPNDHPPASEQINI